MAQRIRLRGISDGLKGRTWEASSKLRVGRLAGLEMVLDETSVSRRHAELRWSGNGWIVKDLGSTNGTFLNGTRLGRDASPINNYDVIRFGTITMVAEIFESEDFQGSALGNRGVAGSSDREPSFGGSAGPIAADKTPPIPGGHKTLWKVAIPRSRPLATPAIANGTVFLGGGFGSHEFYAFDADTGAELWKYHTKDDGPSAAIVEDDLVAFNTESCELEVLTAQGTPLWKRWLGDPLMSMPAAAQGRVFIVYPDSRGDRHHYLAGFHLRTGQALWRQPVDGAAITAPVLAEGNVYVTTLKGTLWCFRQVDGTFLWQDARSATSSPTIWKGQCYYSRREQTQVSHPTHQESVQNECMSSSHSSSNIACQDFEQTWRRADYLDYTKRQSESEVESLSQSFDTSVGFHNTKGDSDMGQSQTNLGHGTVAGVWSYQGSRPFVSQDRLYNCMGEYVLCLAPSSGQIVWKTKIVQGSHRPLDQVLTPPILVNGKVFVGTSCGEVACLSAESGTWLWREIIGEPIHFQPAIANGRIFVPTRTGSLYCLDTGDAQDDGWSMWGGDARHNGAVEAPVEEATLA